MKDCNKSNRNYVNFGSEARVIYLLAFLLFVACADPGEVNPPGDDEYIYDSCVPLRIDVYDRFTEEFRWTYEFQYENGRLVYISDTRGYDRALTYDGRNVVRMDRADPIENSIQYDLYRYNSQHQITEIEKIFIPDPATNTTLTDEFRYTYDDGEIKRADLNLRGNVIGYIEFFGQGSVIDSFHFFRQDGSLLQRERFDWDDSKGVYSNLNYFPEGLIAEGRTPFANPYNLSRRYFTQYDSIGNVLLDGSNFATYQRLNEYNYPTEFINHKLYKVEYVNCK